MGRNKGEGLMWLEKKKIEDSVDLLISFGTNLSILVNNGGELVDTLPF